MRKINERHSDKDRIVCVSLADKQKFYYQPHKSNNRIWLFDTEFSGSVFAYFRKKGRNIADRGFSLTIREIYQFNNYKNEKMARVFQRIPVQVNYVLKNEIYAVNEMKFNYHHELIDSYER
ncbi:hypothetical protein P261_00142 [Lachnospiraceae bacterium TWA4]|nr:hypothetical protein P261_00142 [Lachnospiraceae bacterium TWA4]